MGNKNLSAAALIAGMALAASQESRQVGDPEYNRFAQDFGYDPRAVRRVGPKPTHFAKPSRPGKQKKKMIKANKRKNRRG